MPKHATMSKARLTFAAVALFAMNTSVNAIVGPNYPYGGVVLNAGSSCKIGWTLDTTGTWKNMAIQLMTGDNFHMVPLTTVVTGLDGTTGEGSFTWPCPTVDPPAPIYFYQFTNNGMNATWTTRFTIATASGQTVPAPNALEPDGSAIPWGTGKIVGGSTTASTTSTSTKQSTSEVARSSVPTTSLSLSSPVTLSTLPASTTLITITTSSSRSLTPLSSASSAINNQAGAQTTTRTNSASSSRSFTLTGVTVFTFVLASFVLA